MNIPLERSISFWDLGSLMGRVYSHEKGVLINDATFIARRLDTKEIVLVGKEAYQLLDKLPPHLEILPTLQKGVVANERLLSWLISYWKTQSNKDSPISYLIKPIAMVSVPASIDPTHVRAMTRSFLAAGYGDVILVPDPLALLAFHDLSLMQGCSVVLDSGFGKSEISCTSHGGVLVTKRPDLSISTLMIRLGSFIQDNYELSVSHEEIANLLHVFTFSGQKKKQLIAVLGKDIKHGSGRSQSLSVGDVSIVVETFVDELLQNYFELLPGLNTSVLRGLQQNGMILAGGLSRIDGVDLLISQKIQLPVSCIARSDVASVLGCARLFENWDNYAYMRMKTHA